MAEAKSYTASTHKKINTMMKSDIDKVNINSINKNSIIFNSKCSVITENLCTSSSQATLVVPYKVDSGSDGNIMPFHIFFKKIIP